MLRIAICDDEAIFTEKIRNLTEQILNEIHMDYKITEFSSGTSLADSVNAEDVYDIVFLDIQMPDMDGIATVQKLRDYFKDRDTVLIYISSYDTRAKEVFCFGTHRFLSKPIDSSLFQEALLSACTLLSTKKQEIYNFTDTTGTHHRLFYDEIHYLTTATNHRIEIKTVNDSYCLYGKLCDIKKQINSTDFLLIHQSFLVNYTHICSITYTEVTMDNDAILPISKSKQKFIRNQYKELRKKKEAFQWR